MRTRKPGGDGLLAKGEISGFDSREKEADHVSTMAGEGGSTSSTLFFFLQPYCLSLLLHDANDNNDEDACMERRNLSFIQ